MPAESAAVAPTDPGGMFSLADPDRLRAMVQASGLAVRRTETVPVELPYSGVEDYIAQEIEQPGRRGDFFRDLAGAKRAQFGQLATTLLEPYRAGAGYLVPGETLNALASKDDSQSRAVNPGLMTGTAMPGRRTGAQYQSMPTDEVDVADD